MAADEPTDRRPEGEPDQPTRHNVSNAIKWFSADRSRTHQAIPHSNGPITPGRLLDWARFDIQLNQLLDEKGAKQSHALIRAQAEWLIRWMPMNHNPPALDSAQQAGRAWGFWSPRAPKSFPIRKC
ncbi:hypothetical protein ABZV29_41920 [Streptomyces sp. NPDC005236]|uniref:hypothetical protein n=1 Tax=Streptomyces sp. NPDC005236 TaxID=3157028 RepID=UPI0033B2054C